MEEFFWLNGYKLYYLIIFSPKVSDIVSSTKFIPFTEKDDDRNSLNDLSRKIGLRFFCGHPTPPVPSNQVSF